MLTLRIIGSRIIIGSIAATLAFGLAACGDDNSSCETNCAADAGGAADTGGTADAGGTTGTPNTPITNLPASAQTIVKNTTAGGGLQLVSLNLLPDAMSSLNYVELFGEVKNAGASTVCYPKATFAFTDSSGTVLWAETAFADTPPYVSTSTLSSSCLEPGQSGAIWANDLPSTPMTVNAVSGLTVSLDGLAWSVKPFPHVLDVSIVQDKIYMDDNHWAMSGSFTPGQTVRNIGIAGYTKAAGGLLTGRLAATNLGTVLANTVWQFSTDVGIEGARPSALLAYPHFILDSSSLSAAGSAESSFFIRDTVLEALSARKNEFRRAAEARQSLAASTAK